MTTAINEHGGPVRSVAPPNEPPPASTKTPGSERGMTLVPRAHCPQHSRPRVENRLFFMATQGYPRALIGQSVTETLFQHSIDASAADDARSHTGQRE